jgi:hypothetical protein
VAAVALLFVIVVVVVDVTSDDVSVSIRQLSQSIPSVSVSKSCVTQMAKSLNSLLHNGSSSSFVGDVDGVVVVVVLQSIGQFPLDLSNTSQVK